MAYAYMITCPAGKSYIGVTSNLTQRLREHKSKSNHGSSLPIHEAIREFGMSSMQVTTLVIGEKPYLFDFEKTAIKEFSTIVPDGYNIMSGGIISPMKNPTVAKKNSKSKTGKKNSKFSLARMGSGNPRFGVKLTSEAKAHLSSLAKSRPPVNCLLCRKEIPIHVIKRHFAACSTKGVLN
jgi:group I intron endonuclease